MADNINSTNPSDDTTRLRWETATGRTPDEQRVNLSQAMRDTGDCKLIWVNEGDLLITALQETGQ